MKKALFCSGLLLLAATSFAQKKYTSSGGELIFSMASYSDTGDTKNTPLRVSAFFHVNERFHYSFGKNTGLMLGYNIRNVGFTVKHNDTLTKKHRVYTLGVPVALKFGNMEARQFFFLGAEAEVPFNYKEKMFDDKQKSKFNEWFSKRTATVMPSVFVGFQTRKGWNFIAKYYLTGFFNQDFQTKGVKVYQGIDAQMFYVSLSYHRKNKKGGLKKKEEKTPTITRL